MQTDKPPRSAVWLHLAFWACVLLLAVGFELLVRERVLSPAAYATPSETITRLGTLFTRDRFAADVWATARRTLLSVFVGFPAGVAVAIGLYALGRARSSGEMVLDFVRSTPLTAAIPILVAVWGFGEASKVAAGSVAAVTVTAVTVWAGIRDGLRRHTLLLRLYRPTFGKRLRLVVLPSAGASLAAAVKLSVSAALVLVVVAEMLLGGGNQGGIGKVINDRTYGDDRPAQFAAVVAAGLLGYFLNVLFGGARWLFPAPAAAARA